MSIFGKLLVVCCLLGPSLRSEASRPSLSEVVGSTALPEGSNGTSTSFTVRDETEVPGKTLPSGTYTIQVLDHLSDRMIVRVERQGKVQSVFLALPKSSLARSGQGPILLNSGAKPALRGFVFPDGTVAEFVYPKGEAVGLAKSNNTTIPAIDPASEGRPDPSKLSREDMQMVTLWMLTPTPVTPQSQGAGVSAVRYQVPNSVSTREADTPSSPAHHQIRSRPVLAVLPHTAGNLPLIILLGSIALSCAAMLRRRRV